mmetsp:Transcript_27595/g.64381  ORF Transcript_27595/g.64381 Transcript_27595/m.64381 type:complete len:245 (+) Transcript_27595:284-1018(+)
MAWLCGCIGSVEKELRLTQYAIEKANTEASTRLRNAQKYYRAKNFLEAALEARAGLHAWPDDGALVTDELKAELGYTLAASLLFEGEHEDAIVEGNKVRELTTDNYTIQVLNAVTLAETLRRLKRAEEAREMGEVALKRIKQHNQELAVREIERSGRPVKFSGAHADVALEPTTRITEEICAYLHVIVAEGYMKDRDYLKASSILRDGLKREDKIEEDTRAMLYKLLAQSLHLIEADSSFLDHF